MSHAKLPAAPPPGNTSAAYADDLAAWAAEQSALLRAGRADAADLANVAEEIESLGESVLGWLASHIATVVKHLMKLELSPASLPRAGWRGTVTRARLSIRKTLGESPSLRPLVPGLVAEAVADARAVVAEDLADFGEASEELRALDYTEEQVLLNWWPGSG